MLRKKKTKNDKRLRFINNNKVVQYDDITK